MAKKLHFWENHGRKVTEEAAPVAVSQAIEEEELEPEDLLVEESENLENAEREEETPKFRRL